jgi:hypothetical protein
MAELYLDSPHISTVLCLIECGDNSTFAFSEKIFDFYRKILKVARKFWIVLNTAMFDIDIQWET